MKYHEVYELINKHLDPQTAIPPLYHYTSVYGLEGIMQGKSVWVSHSDFLNDKTERLYSEKIFVDIIQKKFKTKVSEELKKFPPLISLLDNIIETFQRKIVPTFILSLSTNKDSNLLWSNYSKDDGYNIKFDPEFLKNTDAIKQDEGFKDAVIFKSKVIYDEQKHILALNELADNYVEHFFNTKQSDEEFGKNLSNMHIAFQVFAAFFKDSCFRQEEEWRVVLFARTEDISINHRIMNGAFIPYVKLSFDKNLIRGVTIGPKNKMDISEKGLKSFLRTSTYDLESIEINKSKIPYRY
ncbi:DUF2971 domain-containing protein [Bacillus sp. FSL P4-0248]|uniref:DUF2971 domain-containing protein n=1 Tax=Bacillus sp. FSL P4-0248 TaxID=2954582 RepID=UPI0031588148